ncbi:hypothetical protein BN2476_670154 [Paraburkholderia piptadeniae]|uniref:Uncharacterized protein n=1 Tax=Paraburkholderia piptadeniae TaxID=1701573 RepID=A0A1N7SP27_9BURK|nr:hypothetical protein BN2476_670154 [Paraburkholderia piptadeniae]
MFSGSRKTGAVLQRVAILGCEHINDRVDGKVLRAGDADMADCDTRRMGQTQSTQLSLRFRQRR